MSTVRRKLLHAVLGVVAHPRFTLLVCGGLLAVSIALALTSLSVSSDQNKLFSQNAPVFKAYLDFDRKFPENDALYIMIEPKPGQTPLVERWTALADAIVCRMRDMPELVSRADAKVPVEQLGDQALLFDPPEKLHGHVDDLVRFEGLVRLWGEKPGLASAITRGGTPMERFLGGMSIELAVKNDPQEAAFAGLLADYWVKTLNMPKGYQLPDLASLGADDPSGLGYFYVPDMTNPGQHLLAVQVYPRVDYSSLTAITDVVRRLRQAIAEVARGYPEFDVGTTGRPALDADEMEITDRDSTRAQVVALVVVFFGMALMLRSFWLALSAEISLVVAIGWTFGYATLVLGELNLLSLVFLIALIGIGLDYLVQILMAYRREARRRLRAKAIWARVFISVGPPINTACLGAACAFLVSLFTDFRGAAELGIVAGGGLLLCLIAGHTVLPALLVLLPPRFKQIEASDRYAGRHAQGFSWRMVFPVLWIMALIVGLPFMLRTTFNSNLLELQAPDLPAVKLVSKLQDWQAVVLSQDLEMLRRVRATLDGGDGRPASSHIARTESILDAYDNRDYLMARKAAGKLPEFAWAAPDRVTAPSLDALARRATVLADRICPPAATRPGDETSHAAAESLRQFAALVSGASDDHKPVMAANLSAWQEGFVEQMRGMMATLAPPPLQVGRLPAQLRNHLVSADGYYALYIIPSANCWKRENLRAFMEDVEGRIAAVPGHPPVTGIACNIYHTTRSIQRSFYLATAYALGLILLLVFLDLGNLGQTLMAVSVLGLGLPMLLALMGLLKIEWNFANFFGLPILIGAGHEYGVFMVHRYREAAHDPRRTWRRFDTSDRALMLCAFITSSSFGFYWFLGHHKGLRSLGLVMALGSACIYLASLLVLRPLLLWRLARRLPPANGVSGHDAMPATIKAT